MSFGVYLNDGRLRGGQGRASDRFRAGDVAPRGWRRDPTPLPLGHSRVGARPCDALVGRIEVPVEDAHAVQQMRDELRAEEPPEVLLVFPQARHGAGELQEVVVELPPHHGAQQGGEGLCGLLREGEAPQAAHGGGRVRVEAAAPISEGEDARLCRHDHHLPGPKRRMGSRGGVWNRSVDAGASAVVSRRRVLRVFRRGQRPHILTRIIGGTSTTPVQLTVRSGVEHKEEERLEEW